MPPIIVTISVDWEGRHIRDENLDVMYHFRQRYPIPLTHFICPAYFTRGTSGTADPCVAGRIRSQVRHGDEVALHLHCWESLIMACGVAPLENADAYNYCGPDGDPEPLWVPYGENSVDTGQGVALGAYTPGDLRRILDGARAILANNGLGDPRGFRAGGWTASDPVLTAVAGRFDYDSSATDAELFRRLDERDPKPLYRWISRIWGPDPQTSPPLANAHTRKEQPDGIGGLTQPYTMSVDGAELVELPDGGALVDYVSEDWMRNLFIIARDSNSVKPVFVHLGFQQESARISYDTLHRRTLGETDNLERLARLFEKLKSEERIWDHLEFLTAGDAVRKYLRE